MKLDVSVAPEIARLAVPPHDALPEGRPAATVGYLAGCLRALVADPERWWGLVRFDARQGLRVPVPATPAGCEAWLVVTPPGAGHDHGWSVACVVAGELEQRPGSRVLLPGRVLVRGGLGSGQLVNVGAGYAISLHAR